MGNKAGPPSGGWLPHYGDVKDPNIRARYGYLEAWVSIAGNAGLFVLKLFLGLLINSISLIADAFHTLSDVGTSGVVIFGFKVSQKPPDREHPHGHGRVEYISTLVIAILLVITGLAFARESIMRFGSPEAMDTGGMSLVIGAAIIATAVGKEMMARFSMLIGRRISSDILIADAWHHRSDALASVAVGAGIIGSFCGYPILDPILGLVVSGIIIWVGVVLFRRSSDLLIGPAPDDATVEEVEAIAGEVKGIRGVHDIQVHDYGTTRVISLHAEVGEGLRLERAHGIADRLEGRLCEKLGCTTIIHLDPVKAPGKGKPGAEVIERVLRENKDVVSYNRVQIIRRRGRDRIKITTVVDERMPVARSHELAHRLEGRIRKEYGPSEVDIHFEPCCDDCDRCSVACASRRTEP